MMELILGHNQFIGISHISDERSREREKYFSDVKNIYNVVEKAAELGYRGMIIETLPRMLEFLKYYERNRTFDMELYLQFPYVQNYIQKMNENGLLSLIQDIIHRSGLKNTSIIAVKNIVNLVKKDFFSLAVSFLELEIKPFMDLNIKAVLLHNVFTDVLLSLGISDCMKTYIDHVQYDMGLNPGFITLNFELFQRNFEKWHMKPQLVMTPINPGGYDMNPSKAAVEVAIKKYRGEIIAMNILGGGAFSVNIVHDYLTTLGDIKFCVVGASSEKHLSELADIFKNR
ncbi:Uncharacterised protein [uncultured archaeon]|nr:Uncharacterised protein [uncultured archaeon]